VRFTLDRCSHVIPTLRRRMRSGASLGCCAWPRG